jgi:hypothetical protein
MTAVDGALYGNCKEDDDGAGLDDDGACFKQDDRMGVLLDLGDGSLCFFKNGVQHGPGYSAASVTGPVVAAVQQCKCGTTTPACVSCQMHSSRSKPIPDELDVLMCWCNKERAKVAA